MKNLGTPTTLGEFRKLTEQYPDETLLQFRNEPVHDLIEIDGELCFQETNRWDISKRHVCIIGGIDESRRMDEILEAIYHIPGNRIMKWPELPDDKTGELHQILACKSAEEFKREYLGNMTEHVKNLNGSMTVAIESIKSLSEEMEIYDRENSIIENQNKKRKGHERPYKYHR